MSMKERDYNQHLKFARYACCDQIPDYMRPPGWAVETGKLKPYYDENGLYISPYEQFYLPEPPKPEEAKEI